MNVVTLLAALEFAADKHRRQKRKDAGGSPYVNHLIAVAHILAAEGALEDEARQLKIADKIANTRDIVSSPPADWSGDRKLEYFAWAEQVVADCRGTNPGLERAFDETIAMAREHEEHVTDFATFVAGSSWRFAKTYVESYPHEYTLVQTGDTDRFQAAIACIERWGIVETFWSSQRRYLYADGRKYWHMGNLASQKPEDRPTLINRSWIDVARYREEARALGYDGERLKQLVAHWRVKLDEAKRLRSKSKHLV